MPGDDLTHSKVEQVGGAARGYSWKQFEKGNQVGRQFEPGNEIRMAHGSYSPKKVDPLARQLVDDLLAGADSAATAYLHDESFRPALWRWARTYARVELLEAWLADRAADGQPGELLTDGTVRPAMDLLARLDSQLLKAASSLGLDPLSRSRLGQQLAATQVDLVAVARVGAAALAARPASDTIDVEHQAGEDSESNGDGDDVDDR